MKNERKNWLQEESKRAKSETDAWPEWRKETVVNSTPYGFSDGGHQQDDHRHVEISKETQRHL